MRISTSTLGTIILVIFAIGSAPAGATTGGPDAFGYYFTDSDEPNGPVFSWIDLQGTGSALSLSDDSSQSVSIGFDYSFYGTTYSEVTVWSNGAIAFTNDYMSLSGPCPMPNTGTPQAFVAPFWNDMNPSSGGTVYTETQGTAPNQVFIVHYREVVHYGTSDPYDFQILLYENGGTIELQYNSVNPGNGSYDFGAGATVGIQGDSSNYLEYSCNSPALADGLTIQFYTCSTDDLDGDGYSDCTDDCDDNDAFLTPADTDQDGYSTCEGDCDDSSANASPDMEESCDGVDNDCNGLIDDGLDYDYDSYSGCDGEDCDDYNSNVYPGATEIPYDNIDQDCDGSDLTDIDGDGFDGGLYGADCDDQNPDINPDADEICDNGIDDNCNEVPDEHDEDCGAGDDDSSDDDYNPGVICFCDSTGGSRVPAVMALLLVVALRRLRR